MGRLVEILIENNKDRFTKSVDVLEKSGITFFTEISEERADVGFNESIINVGVSSLIFILSIYEDDMERAVFELEQKGVKLNKEIFRYVEDEIVEEEFVENKFDEPTEPIKATLNVERDERGEKPAVAKDFFFGALWIIVGLSLTAADLGFVFWGAIVYGGFRIFRGITT